MEDILEETENREGPETVKGEGPDTVKAGGPDTVKGELVEIVVEGSWVREGIVDGGGISCESDICVPVPLFNGRDLWILFTAGKAGGVSSYSSS